MAQWVTYTSYSPKNNNKNQHFLACINIHATIFILLTWNNYTTYLNGLKSKVGQTCLVSRKITWDNENFLYPKSFMSSTTPSTKALQLVLVRNHSVYLPFSSTNCFEPFNCVKHTNENSGKLTLNKHGLWLKMDLFMLFFHQFWSLYTSKWCFLSIVEA